jgi:hypothetical protein
MRKGEPMAKKDSDDRSELQNAEQREQPDETTATVDAGDDAQRVDVDLGADVPQQLPDAAARLDVFGHSSPAGLEDAAKATGNQPLDDPANASITDVFATTDQLGRPIIHDGPGIAEMEKDALKHGVDPGASPQDDIDALNAVAHPASSTPETPLWGMAPRDDPQRDPSLVSGDHQGQPVYPKSYMDPAVHAKQLEDELKRDEERKAALAEYQKSKGKADDGTKDGGTKYTTGDPEVEPGKGPGTPIDETPAGAHDLLGQRVNPLDGPDDSQQPELDDKTIAGVVKAHSGPPPDEVLTNPDEQETVVQFDPANLPSRWTDAPINTGDPNDPNATGPRPQTATPRGPDNDTNPHTTGGDGIGSDDDKGPWHNPILGPITSGGDTGITNPGVFGGSGQNPVVGGGTMGGDHGSVAMDQDAATAAPAPDAGVADQSVDTGAAAAVDQPDDAGAVDAGAAPTGMSTFDPGNVGFDQSTDASAVDSGSDFNGPPPAADAPPDSGGSDYDDDLAEGGPVPDIG